MIAIVGLREIKIIDKNIIDLRGIRIPPLVRHEFGGQSTIKRDDPLLYEAFIKARCFDLISSGYQLTKDWASKQEKHASKWIDEEGHSPAR